MTASYPEKALLAVKHFQSHSVSAVAENLVIKGICRGIGSTVSFWYALVVETALDAGVNSLVSDDLQDG
ncbi:MAG: hypothetical protein KDH88_16675 [Chromatiales bacterium]|nr:hypothetical protein [Chromatiales bacterium]